MATLLYRRQHNLAILPAKNMSIENNGDTIVPQATQSSHLPAKKYQYFCVMKSNQKCCLSDEKTKSQAEKHKSVLIVTGGMWNGLMC